MIAYQLMGFIIEGNRGNEKYMEGYMRSYLNCHPERNGTARPASRRMKSRDLVFCWESPECKAWGGRPSQPEYFALNARSFDFA